MHRTTVTLGSVGIAGLITTGLLALPVTSALAAGEEVVTRDEDTPEIVLVADEDDDDTADRLGDDTRSGVTSGVDSNDGTNSRVTAVSRDRDRSRGDKTRDFTRDGGDRTRDRSAGATNDRSRNDTRR